MEATRRQDEEELEAKQGITPSTINLSKDGKEIIKYLVKRATYDMEFGNF